MELPPKNWIAILPVLHVAQRASESYCSSSKPPHSTKGRTEAAAGAVLIGLLQNIEGDQDPSSSAPQ